MIDILSHYFFLSQYKTYQIFHSFPKRFVNTIEKKKKQTAETNFAAFENCIMFNIY